MEPVVSVQAQALHYAKQLALASWQATLLDEPPAGSHRRGQADALRDATTQADALRDALAGVHRRGQAHARRDATAEIRDAFFYVQPRTRVTLLSFRDRARR